MTHEFHIPDQFNLAGEVIRVRYNPDLIQRNDNIGEAHYRLDIIELMPPDIPALARTRERQEQIFCHELVHFILFFMCQHKLNGDDKFVDLFARFLHQALTTFQFPPDKALYADLIDRQMSDQEGSQG